MVFLSIVMEASSRSEPFTHVQRAGPWSSVRSQTCGAVHLSMSGCRYRLRNTPPSALPPPRPPCPRASAATGPPSAAGLPVPDASRDLVPRDTCVLRGRGVLGAAVWGACRRFPLPWARAASLVWPATFRLCVRLSTDSRPLPAFGSYKPRRWK